MERVGDQHQREGRACLRHHLLLGACCSSSSACQPRLVLCLLLTRLRLRRYELQAEHRVGAC